MTERCKAVAVALVCAGVLTGALGCCEDGSPGATMGAKDRACVGARAPTARPASSPWTETITAGTQPGEVTYTFRWNGGPIHPRPFDVKEFMARGLDRKSVV
jgi:hypothetical protein